MITAQSADPGVAATNREVQRLARRLAPIGDRITAELKRSALARERSPALPRALGEARREVRRARRRIARLSPATARGRRGRRLAVRSLAQLDRSLRYLGLSWKTSDWPESMRALERSSRLRRSSRTNGQAAARHLGHPWPI